jgi:general secretion pathway protein C
MQLPRSLAFLSPLADSVRSRDWKQSLPGLASAVLVLALAWQLVQLGLTILGARATGAGSAAAAARSVEPAVDLRAIMEAHLFGRAGAGTGDQNAVAATQMNLVLVGTIAETDPEKGYAIIGGSPATAKVYAVGKTVTGGTTLHAVYPDRVILDRAGRLESLMLPKKFQGGGAGPVPANGSSALADRLRELTAQAPGTITEILRPQPVFANGQQRGYRVYPGRNREQFSRLGLMPGDLVTAVNGTPLDDPSRGLEILQSMNSAAQVTVTVERNGQPTQVTINNAQLAAEAEAAAAAAPEPVPVTEVPATDLPVNPGNRDQAE